MFFQGLAQKDLCDGEATTEQALARYEGYLARSMKSLFRTTATMLRAFGVTNFTEELSRVWANGGHSILTNPSPDGEWAGCELLFLAMEFSDGWDAAIAGFLSDSIPGAEDMKNKNPSHRGRKDVCPKAAAIYDAVMSFEFSDKYMKILEETNADAAEVMRFYVAQ